MTDFVMHLNKTTMLLWFSTQGAGKGDKMSDKGNPIWAALPVFLILLGGCIAYFMAAGNGWEGMNVIQVALYMCFSDFGQLEQYLRLADTIIKSRI